VLGGDLSIDFVAIFGPYCKYMNYNMEYNVCVVKTSTYSQKKSEEELPLGQYFADFSVSFEANAFLSIYSES
jgi:hypothetical protein